MGENVSVASIDINNEKLMMLTLERRYPKTFGA